MQGKNQQPPYSSSSIQQGMTLNGRYLLQTLLGEGGMGKVFKALDLRREEVQDPNPFVAVKLLNDDVRKVPGAVIALQREAVITQTLKHSGITSVYDYNRDETHAYIVMELIEGYTLDQFIISDYPDGLPPSRSFKLISQLIETIIYAHKKGVVHADIKPSNIKILPNGEVKMMDFGLARVMSLMNVGHDANARPVEPHWTHHKLGGAITPSYATQARLQGRQPVKVDDAFALACVIFFILTGHHPYQRLPANKALDMGKAPERPNRLSKTQWSVLQRALNPNISKDSRVLSALSTAFCPASRKVKNNNRKVFLAATLVLFCLLMVPFAQWVNDELPVWKIRYSEGEEEVYQLAQYMSDRSQPRKEALEIIYLPGLLHRWNDRWSEGGSLVGARFVDRKATGSAFHQDLLIADYLTPYFHNHSIYRDAREALDRAHSSYLIDTLINYESKLTFLLTNKQSVSVSAFMALYSEALLLNLAADENGITQADPRLNYLFRREISRDWDAGHYFPLGEKLQLAKTLFPKDLRFNDISTKLNELVLSRELSELAKGKEALFYQGEDQQSLIYPPVFVRLVKEIKVASSNRLDLNPIYRDRLIESRQLYLSLGGNEEGWASVITQANLEYARGLVSRGQTKDAYEFVDNLLANKITD